MYFLALRPWYALLPLLRFSIRQLPYCVPFSDLQRKTRFFVRLIFFALLDRFCALKSIGVESR